MDSPNEVSATRRNPRRSAAVPPRYRNDDDRQAATNDVSDTPATREGERDDNDASAQHDDNAFECSGTDSAAELISNDDIEMMAVDAGALPPLQMHKI